MIQAIKNLWQMVVFCYIRKTTDEDSQPQGFCHRSYNWGSPSRMTHYYYLRIGNWMACTWYVI